MPQPYESSRRRGVWNHWVPLVLTVTVATVGVAAWVWSQRKDEDHEDNEPTDEYQGLDYENADYGDNPAYGATGRAGAGAKPPAYGDAQSRSVDAGDAAAQPQSPSSGWAALRRTPSPQQFLDSARRTVAAGMTAAGAAVGSALASIREEDKAAYADHETWSEEADAKKDRAAAGPSQSKEANKRRKKVAIVVSADHRLDDIDASDFHEHAVSYTEPWTLMTGANLLYPVHPVAYSPPDRYVQDQALRAHLRAQSEGFGLGCEQQPPASLAQFVFLQHRTRPGPNAGRGGEEPLVRHFPF